MNEYEFASKEQLNSQLARHVATLLAKAITAKGKAFLVVSGGSTPLGFFEHLSGAELAWAKVSITLADERWLETCHPDSNEKRLRESLLINKAAVATFIPLKNQHTQFNMAVDCTNQELQILPTFDVVVLGMGEDGHTASLFPEASNLADGMAMDSAQACIAVEPITAPYGRISLTLSRLLNSQHIMVHITGQKKKAVYHRALVSQTPQSLPIAAFLQQKKVPVSLYWAL